MLWRDPVPSLPPADDDFAETVAAAVVKLKWTDQAQLAGICTADQRPDPGAEIGQMSRDGWTESYYLLPNYGILDSEPEVGESYMMEFLN